MSDVTSGRAVALTLAGSDSSGGAGIQADLKTFTAFKVYGASVITALTAQNTRGVTGVMAVPPAFIAEQADAVASDLVIGAAKTGMLGDTATVVAVAEAVRRHKLAPLIVDPVMVATSGDVLLRDDAVDAVRSLLMPLATLITPNLLEASHLTGQPAARTTEDMTQQGHQLLALGPSAVLIKGGHASGDAADVLVTRDGVRIYRAGRIDTRHTHGTGCSLSAAITAGLVRGLDLAQAIAAAKAFVWHGLMAGRDLNVGAGNGPLDHSVPPPNGDWVNESEA